jgi:type I restriction enzyme S subunit
MLLRWTSVIEEKALQLLGNEKEQRKGYLAKGLVAEIDAYVIAVNACRLRSGPFSYLEGISGFPFAAEAVFPIGPRQLTIDRATMKTISAGHQYRPFVIKDNGSQVSALSFLNPRYAPISAIWALDLDGGSIVGNREPCYVVHNPLARNPIGIGFLPADAEYAATQEGDSFTLRTLEFGQNRPATKSNDNA